jgi:hypothetical protein
MIDNESVDGQTPVARQAERERSVEKRGVGPLTTEYIALYGNVRCPGRGHDIVKSHDIVGAPTISCRHDIVSPPTILLREYDIVPRS